MFDAAKRPSPKKQSQQEKDRGKGPASSSRTTLPPNLLWHQIATSVQTKRAVSAPDDPYEREADRVADQVMRMDTAAFTPQCAACSRSPDQHEVSRLQEAPTVPKTLKLSAISPRTVISRQAEGGSAPVQTGATAEREREVEAIEIGKTSYVLYQTKVRGGGSSAWLANNPGNLDYTDDTVAWGSYDGKKLAWGKHRFAIFPNEEQGMYAVRKFLRKHQTTRSIRLMMALFAPATDLENEPTDYADAVAARLGVKASTEVRNLSDAQIATFAEEIKVREGWTPGPVNDVPRGDPSLPEEIRDR